MAEPLAEADWQEAAGQGGTTASARDAMLVLSVAGFEGPLDFLLEMVRRHRVDLGPLSIVALTNQLVAALEAGAHRVPLARRSTWRAPLAIKQENVKHHVQHLAPIHLAGSATVLCWTDHQRHQRPSNTDRSDG